MILESKTPCYSVTSVVFFLLGQLLFCRSQELTVCFAAIIFIGTGKNENSAVDCKHKEN